VGSGYGVSLAERYSVRNVTPCGHRFVELTVALHLSYHDTVMMPAGGSLGINFEENRRGAGAQAGVQGKSL
jgi:hypothetical protein